MKTNELMEECMKRFSSPKIDKLMDLHIEALEKAYDAGYNDAMKEALKWLEQCLYYHDCGDYDIVSLSDDTIEDALERFEEDNSLNTKKS